MQVFISNIHNEILFKNLLRSFFTETYRNNYKASVSEAV